mmetsp:Transcript_12925/g.30317  ORF Transcript_12925/g.30317 Transcript_12925/m.30317 type:complete len:214 (+) Transcript_12925:172-813(+)
MTTATPDAFAAYMTAEPAPETKGFVMQQTMLRVKDPFKSLDFYTKVLGFKLLMYKQFPQWGFSVFFVAPRHDPLPEGDDARWEQCMRTPGCIELTWNHGSETEAAPMVYNTGNADATGTVDGQPIKGGFGHIGITCADVYAACERFQALGAVIHKSPNAGGMKGLAFIKDPDNYLIEILPHAYDLTTGAMPTQPIDCMGIKLDGGAGYKDNSK